MPRHVAKRPVDIRSLARTHTETAIRVLAGIMGQRSASPAARVAAASVLLDRGWGKAVAFSTSDAAEFRSALGMSDDELARIVSGDDMAPLSDQFGQSETTH